MGTIPDWTPIYYQWDQVKVPYYVQDTEAARRDISAQYTTISRLDRGMFRMMQIYMLLTYYTYIMTYVRYLNITQE